MAALLPCTPATPLPFLFKDEMRVHVYKGTHLVHIFLAATGTGLSLAKWAQSTGLFPLAAQRINDKFYYSYTPADKALQTEMTAVLEADEKHSIAVDRACIATVAVVHRLSMAELQIVYLREIIASEAYALHEGPFAEEIPPFIPRPLPEPWHDLPPSRNLAKWALSFERKPSVTPEKLIELWQNLAASLAALPEGEKTGIIKAGSGLCRSVVWTKEDPNLWILLNKKCEGDCARRGVYKTVTNAYNMRHERDDASVSMSTVFLHEGSYKESSTDIANIKRELGVYRELKGRSCVLDLLKVVTYPHRKAGFGDKKRMLLPLLKSDLSQAMSAIHKQDFPTRLKWCQRLAEKVTEYHARGYSHSDLKPANIGVVNDAGEVVLLDFGSAQKSDEQEPELFTSFLYASPEQMHIYLMEGYDAAAFAALDLQSADIWSLAVIFLDILVKQYVVVSDLPLPHLAREVNRLPKDWFLTRSKDIAEKEAPKELKGVFDFINRMAAPEPKERPSSAEVGDFFRTLKI